MVVVAGEGGRHTKAARPRIVLALPDGRAVGPRLRHRREAVTIPLATRSQPGRHAARPDRPDHDRRPALLQGQQRRHPRPHGRGSAWSACSPDGEARLAGSGGTGAALRAVAPGAMRRASGRPTLAPDGEAWSSRFEEALRVESRIFTVGQRLQAPTGWRALTPASRGWEGSASSIGWDSSTSTGWRPTRRAGSSGSAGGEKGFGAVVRLRADGGVDRTFNGGVVANPVGGARPIAVALQSSGRIIVLGDSGAAARGLRRRPRCRAGPRARSASASGRRSSAPRTRTKSSARRAAT